MAELRLIAKDACNALSDCPAILTDGERVLVVGTPTTLPDGAPSGVGAGEAVVAIPADLLDQALRAELNRLAEESRHWEEMQQLRDQQHELRARQQRMAAAHLADREQLVLTHRQLASVIGQVRDLALNADGTVDPDKLLAVVGDHGVCTITAEDP